MHAVNQIDVGMAEGPNITRFRSVRPRDECEARSCGPRYASTLDDPAMRFQPPDDMHEPFSQQLFPNHGGVPVVK
jgi:hypothetical protein